MRIISPLLILSVSIILRQISMTRANPIKHVRKFLGSRTNDMISMINLDKNLDTNIEFWPGKTTTDSIEFINNEKNSIPNIEMKTPILNSKTDLMKHLLDNGTFKLDNYTVLLSKYLPQIKPISLNTNDQNDFNTPIQTESDQTNNNYDQQQQFDDFNVLLISQSARNELAQHIFNELIVKNFTDSLDTSPIRLNAAIKEALSSAVNEPNILMDNSQNALSSSNTSGFISQSQASSIDGSLLAAATAATGTGGSVNGAGTSHLGSHISSGGSPKPYFGDALYSFQSMYWPIHCVICLIICTLGIFANVTNIIVLTR